jgi:hypothetical protein
MRVALVERVPKTAPKGVVFCHLTHRYLDTYGYS